MPPSIINIVPGASIGDFCLSMSSGEVLDLIKRLNLNFEISRIGSGLIIRSDDYCFWIDGEKITQISISNNQNAKIAGICGIGDTLKTWEREMNTKFIYDNYINASSEIEGLGLDIEEEPEDNITIEEIDKFDEGNLKVETVYIFPIKKENYP